MPPYFLFNTFPYTAFFHFQAQRSGEESIDTLYNIVICATLRVNFASKSKANNVSPKRILKSKALDKIIQARKISFARHSKELFAQRIA